MWSITLKASESMNGSFQPNNHGTRMRCPELETGRNSVRPWTSPMTSAWMDVSTRCLLAIGGGLGMRNGPAVGDRRPVAALVARLANEERGHHQSDGGQQLDENVE